MVENLELQAPLGVRASQGDVPGGNLPGVFDLSDLHEPAPKSTNELDALAVRFNGVPVADIDKELTELHKEGKAGSRFIRLPFMYHGGWKVIAGVAGVTLTVAAVAAYAAAKYTLEGHHRPRKGQLPR